MASVLVAYAPKHGFTQEVAEAVAAALGEDGFVVDLRPAKAVRGLDAYGAVVLGIPFQPSGWHKDVVLFLRRHQPALARLPVAVFALGPLEEGETEWQEVQSRFERTLAELPGPASIASEVFAANTLGFRWRVIPAFQGTAAGEARDWTAVRAWVRTLAAKLRLAEDKDCG